MKSVKRWHWEALVIVASIAVFIFTISTDDAVALDGDLDGRFQTGTAGWVNDPDIGEGLLLDATVGTSAVGDLGFSVTIQSGARGIIYECEGVEADSTLTALDTPLTMRIRIPVNGYPSGDSFVLTVEYRDASWQTVDTEQIVFSMP